MQSDLAIMRTTVRLEELENRWEITLAPPKGKPPTLDLEVMSALKAALDTIAEALLKSDNGRCRTLVVQSASERYFCVGADIGVLHTLSEETMPRWIACGHDTFNALEDLPIPVVAKMRGYALGGGLELAMACDLIVCDPTAKAGQVEANLGFVPGWGGAHRLSRRIGMAGAKRLFFTGEIVDAQTAFSMGMIDEIREREELDTFIEAFSRTVSLKSPVAIRGFKQLLNEAERPARDGSALADSAYSQDCINSPDTRMRIRNFLNKGRN